MKFFSCVNYFFSKAPSRHARCHCYSNLPHTRSSPPRVPQRPLCARAPTSRRPRRGPSARCAGRGTTDPLESDPFRPIGSAARDLHKFYDFSTCVVFFVELVAVLYKTSPPLFDGIKVFHILVSILTLVKFINLNWLN